VVHNAGLTRDKTLARMPRSAWDAVIDVNLEAVLRSTDVLLRNAQIRDHGRIVVLSSVGGIAGNVGQTNYALTKASLIGWVQTLAHQLASRGITVNAVAPGFIETQMTAQMPTMIKEFARRLSALNQGGLPQDVASAVNFFALPENFGVTGSVLRVCGGALIGA
jgi:3-oxoacyl-[acyl-carrier protein] reductase